MILGKEKGGVWINLVHVPMTITTITTGSNLWSAYDLEFKRLQCKGKSK